MTMELEGRPVWKPGGAVKLPDTPPELPQVSKPLFDLESMHSKSMMSGLSFKSKMTLAFRPAVIDAQLRDGVVEVNLAAMARDDIQVFVVKLKDDAMRVKTLRMRVMPRGIGWAQYDYAAEQDARARNMFIYDSDWHKEGVSIVSANVQHRKVRSRLYAALLDVMIMSHISDLDIGMNHADRRVTLAYHRHLRQYPNTSKAPEVAETEHLKEIRDTAHEVDSLCGGLLHLELAENQVDSLRGGLLHLELSDNQISDYGAKSLRDALGFDLRLLLLSLCANISDYGAKSLRDALGFDRRLVMLSLRANVLSEETESEFIELMKEHRALLRDPKPANNFSNALGYQHQGRPPSPTMTETSRALWELQSPSHSTAGGTRLKPSLSVMSWGDAHLLGTHKSSASMKSEHSTTSISPRRSQSIPKRSIAFEDQSPGDSEDTRSGKHLIHSAPASPSKPAGDAMFGDGSLERQMFISRFSKSGGSPHGSFSDNEASSSASQHAQHQMAPSLLQQQNQGALPFDMLFESAGGGQDEKRDSRGNKRRTKKVRKKVKAARMKLATGKGHQSDTDGEERRAAEGLAQAERAAEAEQVTAGIKEVALMLRDLEIAVSTMEVLQEIRADGNASKVPPQHRDNHQEHVEMEMEQQKQWLEARHAMLQAQSQLAAIELSRAGGLSPPHPPHTQEAWVKSNLLHHPHQTPGVRGYTGDHHLLYQHGYMGTPPGDAYSSPYPPSYTTSMGYTQWEGKGKRSPGRVPPAALCTASTGVYSVVDQMERWFDLYDEVADEAQRK
eukprot:gene10817-4989_t